MGAFHLRRIELVTSLNELVGYKAGLALTRKQMEGILKGYALLHGDDDAMLRVRSEEFDDVLCKLLYAVGNISSPDSMPRIFRLYHEFKKNRRLFPIYVAVNERWNKHIASVADECVREAKPIDVSPVFLWAGKEYGAKGLKVATTLFDAVQEDRQKSSLSRFRTVEWKDEADLNGLFFSENLATPHGEFFDQRFVDFLSHNFQSIDQINWRKFEGLTCEFFHRVGFYVEIGKGRNDDSVDARIWKKGKSAKKPPLILVQCKRQKEKVDKVVVKALHADVVYEEAKLGLVVTSSALSPGARKVCKARSYSVLESNRETLKKWIDAMRTPYSGIFLGE